MDAGNRIETGDLFVPAKPLQSTPFCTAIDSQLRSKKEGVDLKKMVMLLFLNIHAGNLKQPHFSLGDRHLKRKKKEVVDICYNFLSSADTKTSRTIQRVSTLTLLNKAAL